MDDTTSTALAVRYPRRTRASWPHGKKGNSLPCAATLFDGGIDPDEPTALSYSPDYPGPHELRARVRGTWPTPQTERASQAGAQARAVGQAAERAEAERVGVAQLEAEAQRLQLQALLRSCLAAAGDLLSQAAQTAADLQRPSAAELLELSGRLDRLLELEPS